MDEGSSSRPLALEPVGGVVLAQRKWITGQITVHQGASTAETGHAVHATLAAMVSQAEAALDAALERGDVPTAKRLVNVLRELRGPGGATGEGGESGPGYGQ